MIANTTGVFAEYGLQVGLIVSMGGALLWVGKWLIAHFDKQNEAFSLERKSWRIESAEERARWEDERRQSLDVLRDLAAAMRALRDEIRNGGNNNGTA